MIDYWEKFPPVHILVAGYIGYKPKRRVAWLDPKVNDDLDLSALFPGK